MPKLAPSVALAVALLALCLHQAHLQPWTLDDAYITMRYAQNLAEGHGALFNPGGERVEGYTTFLWMLLLSGAASVGADLDQAAKLLGLGLTAGWLALLASSWRWVRGIEARLAALATLIAGTAGITTRWSMSGMEVPLVVFLVVLGLLLHLREAGGQGRPWLPVLTGAVAALALMSRPDAGLLFGALGVERVLRRRGIDRATGAFLASFLILGGGFWAARWSYYGWPLPNTFYVKVGSTLEQLLRGVDYLGSSLMPSWPLFLLFVAALWRARLSQRNPGAWVLPLFVLMHLAYVLAVGGDVFWGWRFLAVVMPAMALLAGMALLDGLDGDRRPKAVALAVVALTLFQLGYTATSTRLNHRGWIARTGVQAGYWFKEHAPADAVLALNIAGSIPLYSGLHSIDMLGLNDVHIAHRDVPGMGTFRAGHEKGDGDYVLALRPDYILLSSALGSRHPRFRGDKELFAREEFHQMYRHERYQLDEDSKLNLFVLRPEFGGKGLHGVEPVEVFDDVRLIGERDDDDVAGEEAEGDLEGPDDRPQRKGKRGRKRRAFEPDAQ